MTKASNESLNEPEPAAERHSERDEPEAAASSGAPTERDVGDGDEAAPLTRAELRESSGGRNSNAVTVLLVLLGLFLGAGVAAVVLTLRDSSNGPTKDVAKSVHVQGTLPSVAAKGPDPALGDPAPTIVGTALDGSPLAIAHDGRPYVLVVLAHWCPHCQASVPQLVQLNSQGVMNGIDVYGIVTATSPQRPNYPPSDWLRSQKWPFPTFEDDANSTTAHKLGVTAFPFYVIVTAKGNVAARLAGDLTDAQFIALFKSLAAGRPLPITTGGASSQSP